jgi:hypothetical protein
VNPDISAMLAAAANGVARATLTCTDPAALGDLTSAAGILVGLARDFDGFVASRVSELNSTRDILHRALALVPDLRPTILEALTVTDREVDDLRVSSLEQRLETLRGALVTVQGALEQEQGDEPAQLLRDSWQLQYSLATERAFPGQWW